MQQTGSVSGQSEWQAAARSCGAFAGDQECMCASSQVSGELQGRQM